MTLLDLQQLLQELCGSCRSCFELISDTNRGYSYCQCPTSRDIYNVQPWFYCLCYKSASNIVEEKIEKTKYGKLINRTIMYCLQWLIPVLLIPKPFSPGLIYNHAMFLVLYLTSFFLERKPCTICSIVFLIAVFLICYSCVGNCVFWQCPDHQCQTEDCSD